MSEAKVLKTPSRTQTGRARTVVRRGSLAPALPAKRFTTPAGDALPAPKLESYLPIELLTVGHTAVSLCTSGFELDELPSELIGRELNPTLEPLPDSFDFSTPPEPVDEPAQAETPAETSRPWMKKPGYEPLEFMDFDEPEEEPSFEAPIFEAIDVAPDPEAEPEPVRPPAPLFETTLPVEIAPRTLGPGKLLQGHPSIALPELPLELSRLALRTLRPKLRLGKNPNAPVPAPAPVAAAGAETVVSTEAPAAAPRPVTKPAPPAPVKPAAEPPKKPIAVERPQPEKPKITVRPAAATAPAPAPERDTRPNRPATPAPKIAARDRSNALPVEHEEFAAPIAAPVASAAAAPKPKLMPIRKPEAPAPVSQPVAAAPEPKTAAAAPVPDKHLAPSITLGGDASASSSGGSKAIMAGAAVLVLAVGGYFMFGGDGKKAAGEPQPEATVTDATSPGMVLGGGGWTTSWGSDDPANRNKQISIYRPSMAMSDYRFEFKGQIAKRAIGWIFRAADARNYYVMKLEMIKPGANPVVALVKYAVINGKETTHTQVMLPFQAKLDTLYDVRLDVKGDKFSTYVQGKLADYWTDDRIKKGGTGFYNENGDRALIKSSQVAYLVSGGS